MIPSIGHFIWFGRAFPWVNALAIQSLAARGGLDRVILHHGDDLSDTRWWPDLEATETFESNPLDPEAVLEETGDRGPQLVDLFRKLDKPAARANMVRAALLYTHGGVYLDLDTITLDSLDPLRERAQVFCGEEHIALPSDVVTSKNPVVLAKAGVKLAVRDVLRRAPQGWKLFRKVEGRYRRAVNNAVLGAEARHDFIAGMLDRMVTMPPERQLVRFALGTHLLQQAVAGWQGEGLEVCPPSFFYPLSPEISEHWFRMGGEPKLFEVLRAETRVVHWYASVRTKGIVPSIDPDYVRRHADEQLFSALARQFLPYSS